VVQESCRHHRRVLLVVVLVLVVLGVLVLVVLVPLVLVVLAVQRRQVSGSQKKFSSIEALLARFPKRPEAAGAIGAAGARSLTMIVDNDVNAASARLQQSQKFVSELLDAQEDFDGVCREQDQLRTTLSSKFSHELHGAYAANESHNLR
jgi:hypothetical protein